MNFTERLLERTKELSRQVDDLTFTFDGYIYNPLDYAWEPHAMYLERYVKEGAKAFFLGMNPGPFGMMQTGVPFGEIGFVKGWMGIEAHVDKPKREHPGRPVLGFESKRSEVSGRRLWGLFSKEGTAQEFFNDNSVFNYCPLGFLEDGRTAKNFTPDKLRKDERAALEAVCDSYLKDVIAMIGPSVLIGVGKYAQAKLNAVNDDPSRNVISIIHPSPGNPQANDNWEGKTIETLSNAGVWQCR